VAESQIPETRAAVFGQDHAPPTRRSRMTLRRKGVLL